MKKVLLIVAVAAFSLSTTAQTSFGALGGLSFLTAKADAGSGFDATDSETGFHLGVFAELEVSEMFKIQPELTYTIAGDVSIIGLNAIAKYNVSEEFNIQLGPQIGFVGGDFGDFIDEFDDSTKLNLQLALGAGYDISEQLFVQARYGFQLNNHFTGDEDFDLTVSGFTAGVGYRF